MPQWGYLKDSATVKSGANTLAGLSAGQQPFSGTTDGQSSWKRNVIATNLGWVRRLNKTTDSTARQQDEVLVAANPALTSGTDDGYANAAHLGFPDIAQLYISSNSTNGNALQANTYANVYVVFNEPIRHKKGSTTSNGHVIYSFRVANTISGNTAIAYHSGHTAVAARKQGGSTIDNANNTLVFRVYLPWVSGKTSTYKINSNTIVSNGITAAGVLNGTSISANIVTLNIPTAGGETANLVITGAVSNNFGTFTVRAAKTGG